MKKRKTKFFLVSCAFLLLGIPEAVTAMGLRSFVALPINKGGVVLRQQFLSNPGTGSRHAVFNLSWGLTGRDSLLLGLPFRLAPSGPDRTGDLAFLYRRTLWQFDQSHATSRVALLAGGVLSTDSTRDNAFQFGAVASFNRDRHSYDIDALFQHGSGSRSDSGRYDFSWQYRLTPSVYPEWGFTQEWFSVLELNGRWKQGQSIDHQITAGLQWVHHNWVLEGGVIRTINNTRQTQYLLSTRFHF